MSLPNSHEVLLRNRHLVQGRLALLGVSAGELLTDLPAGGMAMSEHAGVCASLSGRDGWQICFGYDDPALAADTFDTLVVFLIPVDCNDMSPGIARLFELHIAD